ncbi:YARHG domain-containing protein [Olleya sp. HaHaR_3_96]|uniref:YARHG domain-containing protein n=1 Tax=Olleya sp. HaHaR_3_96 TaxID=2745560 RepID=UPI001C4FA35B|nr:YARHG domain-containing protein [Olleya sp. HaHaR_3_96]QXP61648.1 YARHG domain-containing protein [Olleya sp. HaHaR_3_96]
MKQKILTLLLLSITIASNAQKLENCSECSSIKYSESNIVTNELFELKLLRNEIFARHNFPFKNERLEEYFFNYDWYKPDYKNPVTQVNLNAIEQFNVALFKRKEEEIKRNRELLLTELGKLKVAIKENDTSFISDFTNGIIKNDNKSLLKKIKSILELIDIENINWHKGQAKYEILTDNGFSISSQGIYIKGNSISIISTDPMTHSDLMKNDDAFEYPSDYYSEFENLSGVKITFKNGKLIVVSLIFVG